ncbi:MAG: UDP-2,4-diacetamido-2,4,6-trideoxy-beta-L-altropyranose hydrolase [Deltaproteobacteria bacterium]|jgi:UDP-2,4-diacetamido-2,4,6-trideoxy-beta-L-altropyranose hydrolase|nr:UDP-2,4-diacetamido-2,4,6-trideoxy-beta-L-altropyranose hydrolase [Deltaproteobacteria bacterium]
MKITFRVDASIQIGTGHVMRCLTLADELLGRGAEAVFVCREFDGNLCCYIEEKGYVVLRLPVSNEQEHNIEGNLKHAAWLGVDWQTDARQVEEIIKGIEPLPDWLVVDHYALDERWEGYLRPYCKKIMVIDDLADRPHDCDLLLDQNFYENLEGRYDGLVPAWCKKLLGSKYALLRPEFREARKNLRKRDGQVRRIMIFFGGSDPTNETTKALEAIRMLNRPDIAVDVVVGALNPHRQGIERIASDLPDCTCHFKVEDMAAFMAKADLAVGAGGTTVWERCALGLPILVTTVAENQEKTVSDMAESGYLLFLGRSEAVSVDSLYHALEIAIQSPWLLISFARKTQSLVDGKGVKRIAQEMLPIEITLRMATMDDCEAIFRWRNAEETRKYFFDHGLIKWEDHCRWFEDTIRNPGRVLLIGELHGQEVGVLRYDHVGEAAAVSVYLLPGTHGQGLGPQLLMAGTDWVKQNFSDVKRIRAEVLFSNFSSKKAFEKAGYKENFSVYELCLV